MSVHHPAFPFRRFRLLPYLLTLPTVVFVTVFTVWPVLLSVYQSFFLQRLNIARFREPTFNGLGNYMRGVHNA